MFLLNVSSFKWVISELLFCGKNEKYIWWCSVWGIGWCDLITVALWGHAKCSPSVSLQMYFLNIVLPWFAFIFLFILTGEDIDLFDMEQFKSSFVKILQRALKNVRTQLTCISMKFNVKASEQFFVFFFLCVRILVIFCVPSAGMEVSCIHTVWDTG